MARKRKSHKMPAWKRWVKMGIGIAGAAVGGLVALSPSFRGLRAIFSGDVEGGTRQIAIDTTGIDPASPGAPNLTRIVATGVTVGIGLGLIALFRTVAKRV